MALEFFYRRQKLVIGIMVILMVAFLVPMGISQILSRNPNKQVVAYTGKDPLTLGERRSAEADIYLLQRMPMPQDCLMMVRAFFQANPTKGSPGLNWALLLREADRLGVKIYPRQADQMLESMKPEDRSTLITEISAAGYSEASVKQALVDLLKVKQAFDLAATQAPRPLSHIQRDFRMLSEEIELNMVDFPIEKFDARVPVLVKDELDKELDGLFGQYRQVAPGSGEYGFGYRLSDMVNVAYMVVDHDAIAQAVNPSAEEIANYFMEHRGELTRDEPEPATASSSAPASASAPATPLKMRTVVITKLSEARDQVREILRNQAADRISEQLLRQAQVDLSRMHGQEDAYTKVYQQICPSADELLKAPVTLRGGPQAVKDVVAQLESASGLKIMYPYGQRSLLQTWTVTDDLVVDVTPDWSGKNLGEVLGLLAKAHQWPATSWATCRELPRVLFPTNPVDQAPVRIGLTNLVSLPALAGNFLLKDAYVGTGPTQESLVSLVSKAQAFAAPGAKEDAAVKIGEDYPQPMKLEAGAMGGVNGRLIWRLLQAQASQPAEKMTSEIREKVLTDWRTLQKYKLAVAAAQDMQTKIQANPQSIGDLAAAAGLNVVNSGLFPRKQSFQGMAIPTPIPLSGLDYTRSLSLAMMGQREAIRVVQQQWASCDKFIQQTFEALAPADPQPPYKDVPSKVVSLPLEKKVVLIQRTDYLPALRQQLDDNIDRRLVGDTRNMWEREITAWVDPASIHARLEYRSASGDKTEEQPVNPVGPTDMDY